MDRDSVLVFTSALALTIVVTATLGAAPVGIFEDARDIGGPPLAGSTTLNGTTYTMRGSGQDIWDGGDQLHFAYRRVRGDFTVTLRVTRRDTLPAGAGKWEWGRHGLMARWTLDADSKYSLVATHLPTADGPAASGGAFQIPMHQLRMFHRQAASSRVSHDIADGTFPGELRLPTWFRLRRLGDAIYSYLAEDANHDNQPDVWVLVGSDSTPAMPAELLVGAYICPQQLTQLAGFSFDNVSYVEDEKSPLLECTEAAGPAFATADYENGLTLPPGRTGNVTAVQRSGTYAPLVSSGRLYLSAFTAIGYNAAVAVWYNLVGAEAMTTRGFVAEFDASIISYPGRPTMADGLTFAVVQIGAETAANGTPSDFGGDAGGALGYGNGTLRALAEKHPSFAVELDTWVGGGEPGNEPPQGGSNVVQNAYHVGLDVNGEVSSIQTNEDFGVPSSSLPSVASGGGIRVKVRYTPDGQVDVWVRQQSGAFLEHHVLSHKVAPLQGHVMFGFTSGTGAENEAGAVDNLSIKLLDCAPQPPSALTPAVIDLGNVTGGGDGLVTTPIPHTGIDPRDGLFVDSYYDGWIYNTFSGEPHHDGLNPSPGEGPYIDSVFFPTNTKGGEFSFPMPITLSGVQYKFQDVDSWLGGWNYILSNRNGGVTPPGISVGPYSHFTTAVGLHACLGITYDLDALRARHGWRNVETFSTMYGLNQCGGGEATFYILISSASTLLFERFTTIAAGGGHFESFPIPTNARYLTLVTGRYGTPDCDTGTFARAIITGRDVPLGPGPWLWSSEPKVVESGGGQRITLRGEDLHPGLRYRVGGKSLTEVTGVNGVVIGATLPVLPVGLHDIEATLDDGVTVVTRLRNALDVAKPLAFTSIEPRAVFSDQPTPVTLLGTGFRPDTVVKVRFAGGDAPLESVVVVSDTVLEGRTPRLPAGEPLGAKTLVFEDPRRNFVVSSAITYVDPSTVRLTGVEPTLVSTLGGTPITFFGAGFSQGLFVPRLALSPLTDVVVVSPTELRAKTPPLAAGIKPAQLFRPGVGVLSNLPNAVEAAPPVTLTAVTPRDIYSDRSTRVKLSGVNFREVTQIRIGSQPLLDPIVAADGRSISGRAPPLPLDEQLGNRDVVALDPRADSRLTNGVRYIAPPSPTSEPLGPQDVEGSIAGGTVRFTWFNPIAYDRLVLQGPAGTETLPGDTVEVERPVGNARSVRITLQGFVGGQGSLLSIGNAGIFDCERPPLVTGADHEGRIEMTLYGNATTRPVTRCASGGGGAVEEGEGGEHAHAGAGGAFGLPTIGYVNPQSLRGFNAPNPTTVRTGFHLPRDADRIEISAFYQKVSTRPGLSLKGRLRHVYPPAGNFEDEFTFPDGRIDPDQKEWNAVTYFRAQADVGLNPDAERCPGRPWLPAGDYLLDIYTAGGDPDEPYYVFEDDGRAEELLIVESPCPPYPRVRVADLTGFSTLPSLSGLDYVSADMGFAGVKLNLTVHGIWYDEEGLPHDIDPSGEGYEEGRFSYRWTIYDHIPPTERSSTTNSLEVNVPNYGCYPIDVVVSDRACDYARSAEFEIAVVPPNVTCTTSPYTFSHFTPDTTGLCAIAGLNPPGPRGTFTGRRTIKGRVLVTPCTCGSIWSCDSATLSNLHFRLAAFVGGRAIDAQAPIAVLDDLCRDVTRGPKYFSVEIDDLGRVPRIPGVSGLELVTVVLQAKAASSTQWQDISQRFRMTNRPLSLDKSYWSGHYDRKSDTYRFTTFSSPKPSASLSLASTRSLRMPLPGKDVEIPSFDNGVESGLTSTIEFSSGAWHVQTARGSLSGNLVGNALNGAPAVVAGEELVVTGDRAPGEGGGGGIFQLPMYRWCEEVKVLQSTFSQTLFESLLFAGSIGPVPVTVWASIKLGIDINITGHINVVLSPFQGLLEGGKFVDSSFDLEAKVEVKIPCQIRADVLFGVASIAARLVPQARGDFLAHVGITDTSPEIDAYLGIFLDLYFEVEACLLWVACYTLPRIEIFRNEELVSFGNESLRATRCESGRGGGEPPALDGAAPAGDGGGLTISSLTLVSAPETAASPTGSNTVDAWVDDEGRPQISINETITPLPLADQGPNTLRDPAAAFLNETSALVAWTRGYPEESGVPPPYDNLSLADQSRLMSTGEIVVTSIRSIGAGPNPPIAEAFRISDPPAEVPDAAARRADGRAAIAANPLGGPAFVAWVRYETPDFFIREPGETTQIFVPIPNADPPALDDEYPTRVRAQLEKTAIYVRPVDPTGPQGPRVKLSGAGINIEPTVAFSPTGAVAYCVWLNDPTHEDLVSSSRGRRLLHSVYRQGTGWSAPAPVLAQPDDYPGLLEPDIALSGSGRGLLVFSAMDKDECALDPERCERDSGLGAGSRYIFAAHLEDGVFQPPVRIHGVCQAPVYGAWARVHVPIYREIFEPEFGFKLEQPEWIIGFQGLGPAMTSEGSGNVLVSVLGAGSTEFSAPISLTQDANIHSNVVTTIQGGALRSINLNGGPALLVAGVGGGGGIPRATGTYEVAQAQLEPDLAIANCNLSHQFPGPGCLVTASVSVENRGFAASPTTGGGGTVVGLRLVFVANDGSETTAATAPVEKLAPGETGVVDIQISMPHEPVTLRVELSPNPVDRDLTNNTARCFFGAPAPQDVRCGTVQLADEEETLVARVAWTNPTTYDDLTVYRDGQIAAVLSGTATSFVDPLTNLGAHLYAVRGRIGVSRSARGEVACTIEPPVEGPLFIRGDANDSGQVDISDAISTLGYLFTGAATVQCLQAADTNNSGEVDISDAIGTLSFLFAGGAAPAQPFPGCGLDPTPDALPCVTQPLCR